jgi:hypothetical protein
MNDAEFLAAALVGFEHKRSEIEEKMAELRRRIGGGAAPVPKAEAAKKRTMSAAARRRIAAAQRKRWAAVKKQAKVGKTHRRVLGASGKGKNTYLKRIVKELPGAAAPKAAKKRTMSAAARKRIGEATRKRWAELRKKKAGKEE